MRLSRSPNGEVSQANNLGSVIYLYHPQELVGLRVVLFCEARSAKTGHIAMQESSSPFRQSTFQHSSTSMRSTLCTSWALHSAQRSIPHLHERWQEMQYVILAFLHRVKRRCLFLGEYFVAIYMYLFNLSGLLISKDGVFSPSVHCCCC